eukprot:254638-Rhodomonas_salina.3
MGGTENLLRAAAYLRAYLRMSRAEDVHSAAADEDLTRANVKFALSNIETTLGDETKAKAWLDKAETEFSHVQSSDESVRSLGHRLTFHREDLAEKGRGESALAACQKFHDTRVSPGSGASPKDIVTAKVKLALTFARQGSFADACTWLAQVRAQEGGGGEPEVVLLYAECLQGMGRPAEALPVVEGCVRAMEASHGRAHTETIGAGHERCGILDALGQDRRAQELTAVNIRCLSVFKPPVGVPAQRGLKRGSVSRMKQLWQHAERAKQQRAGPEQSSAQFMREQARALMAGGGQHAWHVRFREARAHQAARVRGRGGARGRGRGPA